MPAEGRLWPSDDYDDKVFEWKDIMMTMMIVYTECDLLVVMAQEDTGHSCLSNSPLPGLRNGLAYVSQAEYIWLEILSQNWRIDSTQRVFPIHSDIDLPDPDPFWKEIIWPQSITELQTGIANLIPTILSMIVSWATLIPSFKIHLRISPQIIPSHSWKNLPDPIPRACPVPEQNFL